MSSRMAAAVAVALCVLAYAGATYPTKYATPTVVTIPLHGGSFQPAAAPDRTDEVLEELRKLNANIERLLELAGGPQPQAAPGGGARDHLAVISDRCLRCHNAADAEKKGGEVVLVDGDSRLVPLTPGLAVKLWRQVSEGTMPPKGSGPPLSDPDRKLLLEWLEK